MFLRNAVLLLTYSFCEYCLISTIIKKMNLNKSAFELAIEFTLRDDIEGGYTVDTGGPTNRGITLATLITANDDGVVTGDVNGDGKVDEEDIKKLPVETAVAIYKHEYWDALDLGDVADPCLAIAAFDTAVNCGVGRTKRWLYDTIEKQKNIYYLLNFRTIHYLNLIQKQPDVYGKYKNGWLRRVNDLKKYLEVMQDELDNG